MYKYLPTFVWRVNSVDFETKKLNKTGSNVQKRWMQKSRLYFEYISSDASMLNLDRTNRFRVLLV